MNKQMSTNCPNCGGELTSEGYCYYCNTKVRYANELIVDLQDSIISCSEVEIMITVKRNNDIILIPFKGYIESFQEEFDTVSCFPIGNNSFQLNRSAHPRLSITFSGYAQKVSETVINETIE